MATDRRARITPKGSPTDDNWKRLLGLEGNNTNNRIMKPLERTGLIFPYTPNVTVAQSANWNAQAFTHSNYPYNSWQNSDPGEIAIMADFTATNVKEAQYMLACIHFLKSAMKGGFGIEDKEKGVPPAVYEFSYLGDYQFNKIPVLITSVGMPYMENVDYVPVYEIADDGTTNTIIDYVPARMTMNISLRPQYNTKTVRDTFNMKDFRSGKLLKSNGFM